MDFRDGASVIMKALKRKQIYESFDLVNSVALLNPITSHHEPAGAMCTLNHVCIKTQFIKNRKCQTEENLKTFVS